MALAAISALAAAAPPAIAGKRGLTVIESIGMRRVKDPNTEFGPTQHFKISPNGKRFFVVEQRGDLDNNVVRSVVRLFDVPTELPAKPIDGKVILEASSEVNAPAISDARWLDSDTVSFLGLNDGVASLYQLDVNSGRTKALARFSDDIVAYDISGHADIVCLLKMFRDPIELDKGRREGYVVRPDEIMTQVDRRAARSSDKIPVLTPSGLSYTLRYRRAGDAQSWVVWDLGPLPNPLPPKVSPDGRFILQTVEDRSLPPPHRQPFPALALMLRETSTGATRPLLKGAVYPLTTTAWSPDSSRVVLLNAWPPGEVTSDVAATTSYSVDVADGKIRVIAGDEEAGSETDDLGWSSSSTLQIAQSRHLEPLPWKEFQFDGNRWHQVSRLRSAGSEWTLLDNNNLGLRVAQSSNRPPYIEVIRFTDGHKAIFSEIEPSSQDLVLGKAEQREVIDRDGDAMRYGLIYPARYVAGQRYPLVIQTHGYNPQEFLVAGPFGFQTAFAARALSDAGFFVVQMHVPDNTLRWFYSSKEAFKPMRAMGQLIDELDEKGLVDPSKVAAIGFSRTCYHIKYAMAHASFKLAAAVVADGIDFGYMQFLGSGNGDIQSQSDFSTRYDGKLPLGEGLRTWIELAPAFNADKIHTPMLTQAIGDRASGEWEMYQALRLAGVPTEMIHFPDGEHDLFKPREQLRSQSATVDWIRFWVQDYVDPAEEKREQYARWGEMKEAWLNEQRGSGALH